LQNKVQVTIDDFKEVVDYFQYTGEGEEVSRFFSHSDLTLLGRWRSGSGINHVFLAQFMLCFCRCNFFYEFLCSGYPAIIFRHLGKFPRGFQELLEGMKLPILMRFVFVHVCASFSFIYLLFYFFYSH